MNIQHCLIWELMLNKFEVGHHTIEASKKYFLFKTWKHVCSEYSNQIAQEILSKLQEPWWSGKVGLA